MTSPSKNIDDSPENGRKPHLQSLSTHVYSPSASLPSIPSWDLFEVENDILSHESNGADENDVEALDGESTNWFWTNDTNQVTRSNFLHPNYLHVSAEGLKTRQRSKREYLGGESKPHIAPIVVQTSSPDDETNDDSLSPFDENRPTDSSAQSTSKRASLLSPSNSLADAPPVVSPCGRRKGSGTPGSTSPQDRRTRGALSPRIHRYQYTTPSSPLQQSLSPKGSAARRRQSGNYSNTSTLPKHSPRSPRHSSQRRLSVDPLVMSRTQGFASDQKSPKSTANLTASQSLAPSQTALEEALAPIAPRNFLQNRVSFFLNSASGLQQALLQPSTVGPRRRKHFTKLSGTSLFCFSSTNPVRRFIFRLIYSTPYTIMSIFLQVLISLLFSLSFLFSPSVFPIINYFYMVVWTMEIVLSIVALGFFWNRHSFLRSTWNALDLILLILGFVTLPFFELSMFRVFLVLRYGKHLTWLSPVFLMMEAVYQSLVRLKATFLSFIVVYYFFTVLGVDMFFGSLHRQCVRTLEDDTLQTTLPPQWCSEIETGDSCHPPFSCLPGQESLDDNITSFDNFPVALLATFRMISGADWDVIYALAAAENWTVAAVYNLSMIFFVALVLVNLIVACMDATYSELRNIVFIEEVSLSTYNATMRALAELPGAIFYSIMYRPMLRNLMRNVPLVKRIWRFFKRLARSSLLGVFFVLFILVNLLLEIFRTSIDPTHFAIVNYIFLGVYVVERSALVIAMGVREYFRSPFRVINLLVVFLSFVTTIFPFWWEVSAFFRIWRMTILFTKIGVFFSFMQLAFSPSSFTIVVFVCIILFGFGLIGTTLFGPIMNDHNHREVSSNFANVFWSMFSLFIVLTGDNWHEKMYMSMSQDVYLSTKILSLPFFVIFFILSSYIVIALCIAVVLDNFEPEEADISALFQQLGMKEFHNHLTSEVLATGGKVWSTGERIKNLLLYKPMLEKELAHKGLSRDFPSLRDRKAGRARREQLNRGISNFRESLSQQRPRRFIRYCLYIPKKVIWLSQRIVNNDWYDRAIIAVTVIAALLLLIESPSNVQTYEESVSSMMESISLFIVYGCDLILRMIAEGPRYFRSLINISDFGVVAGLVLNMTFFIVQDSVSTSAVGLFLIVRVIRGLRPLRLIMKLDALRFYLDSFRKSLRSTVVVTIFAATWILMFGLVAMVLFEGKLDYCSDSSITVLNQCEGMFSNDLGVLTHRAVISPPANFDSLHDSYATLLEILTLSNWGETIWPLFSDDDPAHNFVVGLFFILYIVMCDFFILNLFIGVFQNTIERDQHSIPMNARQRAWDSTQDYIYSLTPSPGLVQPRGPLRRAVYRIVWKKITIRFSLFKTRWKWALRPFDTFFGLLSVVGTIIIASQYYGMPSGYLTAVEVLTALISLLFVIQSLMVLISSGITRYLGSTYNILDMSALAALLLSPIALAFSTSFFRLTLKFITRSLIWMRFLSFVTHSHSIHFMLSNLMLCIPSLFDAVVLLGVFFVGYIFMGMQLFGQVKFQDQYNWNANFRSVPSSALLLMRVLLFVDWNPIFHALSIEAPYCTQEAGVWNDCGNRFVASSYMFSFILICAIIVLNLFISIIMDRFSFSFTQAKFVISRTDLQIFRKTWEQFDKRGTGELRLNRCRFFMEAFHASGCPLALDRQDPVQRNMFWIWFHELSQGVQHFDASKASKHKTWFRADFLAHVVFMIVRKLKTMRRRVASKLNKSSDYSIYSQKRHKVYFNDALLALCRLHITTDVMTIDEQLHRAMFLKSTLKNISALKIQATFHGYQVRRRFRQMLHRAREAQSKFALNVPLFAADDFFGPDFVPSTQIVGKCVQKTPEPSEESQDSSDHSSENGGTEM